MRLRVRSKYFDHLSRALLRFWDAQGGRLAAAIAYYGFFAIFALLLIGYSIFGILLNNNTELFEIVQDFLRQNLPFLDVTLILESGRTVGIIGIIGLTFTGIAWVEAIRSSQRLIWQLNEQPGYVGLRQVLDLVVLLGILILLALSQLAVYGLEKVVTWLATGLIQSMISVALTLAVNMVLAAALLAAVPRLRMTVRRMAPPVLQVGIGVTLLNTVGIVGILGLIFTGVGWVEAIRSSQRLIWRLNQQPGYIGVRQVVDLLVLLGILLLLAVSVFAVYGLEALLDWIAGHQASILSSTVNLILTVAINMVLAAALLAAVPRLRMTARRMLPPVLQVGIGITLLNTVGRFFVNLVERNPAYALVASAVGILVYLYVFNQLLLFGAAWAATSPHGRVVDLSADDKNAPVGQNTWIRYDRPQ